MSTQLDELSAAVTQLTTDVQEAVSAVNDLIAKIEAGAQAADLTDEIAAVKAASASLDTSTADAQNVLNPPAPAE